MNGNNNNNKKPGMGNQGPTDRRQDTGRGGDANRGGDNRPKGNGDSRKPNPGMPSSGSYRPDIRGGNNGSDKMKGDKCPDCGNVRSKCSC